MLTDSGCRRYQRDQSCVAYIMCCGMWCLALLFRHLCFKQERCWIYLLRSSDAVSRYVRRFTWGINLLRFVYYHCECCRFIASLLLLFCHRREFKDISMPSNEFDRINVLWMVRVDSPEWVAVKLNSFLFIRSDGRKLDIWGSLMAYKSHRGWKKNTKKSSGLLCSYSEGRGNERVEMLVNSCARKMYRTDVRICNQQQRRAKVRCKG